MSKQILYGKCKKCSLDIDEERGERINEHLFLKDTNHFLRRKMDKMHATGLCLMCYEIEYERYDREKRIGERNK